MGKGFNIPADIVSWKQPKSNAKRKVHGKAFFNELVIWLNKTPYEDPVSLVDSFCKKHKLPRAVRGLSVERKKYGGKIERLTVKSETQGTEVFVRKTTLWIFQGSWSYQDSKL